MTEEDNLPYGDIFTDDEGMERYIKDRQDKYELSKMMRKECCKRRMSRKKFDEWISKISDIGDDEPLSKYI